MLFVDRLLLGVALAPNATDHRGRTLRCQGQLQRACNGALDGGAADGIDQSRMHLAYFEQGDPRAPRFPTFGRKGRIRGVDEGLRNVFPVTACRNVRFCKTILYLDRIDRDCARHVAHNPIAGPPRQEPHPVLALPRPIARDQHSSILAYDC